MQLSKNTKSLFSATKISLASIAFVCSTISVSYGESFNECFPEKFNFVCKDPEAFLRSNGINVDDDLVSFSDLHLIEEKPTGASKGGIYAGPNQATYFVKHINHPFTELIGSRLMNLVVGTTCTPIVKLAKDKSRTSASLKLENFVMYQSIDPQDKNIVGLVLLSVAMDWIGIVDRHSRNMGYVRSNSRTLLAARVDFDASFDFESDVTGGDGYSSHTNHLSLKHLYITMQNHPKDQVVSAIKKIISIPDEQIIMTVFHAWVILSRTDYHKSLSDCFEIARKLIERKNAFRQALEKPSKKTFEQLTDAFN